MTRKIKVTVHTGYANCKHEDIIEIDDDTTEKECNQIAMDYMWNYIELGWQEITDDNED